MQEAANDLVKTEDDEIGEEHEGERRKEEQTGEEGGPALMEEVGGGVGTPEQGVGEVVGVAGGGEGAVVLNGEEQGEAGMLQEEVRALKGDGERCRRPGLKAEEVLLGSLSWLW